MLVARERTLARIARSLALLAAELSDEEFLRVLRAMLESRARTARIVAAHGRSARQDKWSKRTTVHWCGFAGRCKHP